MIAKVRHVDKILINLQGNVIDFWKRHRVETILMLRNVRSLLKFDGIKKWKSFVMFCSKIIPFFSCLHVFLRSENYEGKEPLTLVLLCASFCLSFRIFFEHRFKL